MKKFLIQVICCAAFFIPFIGAASADYPGAYVGQAELRDIALSPDGEKLALLKTGHEFDFAQRFGWDEVQVSDSATGTSLLELKQTYIYNKNSTNWLFDWVYWPFDDVILASGVEYTVSGKKFKKRSVFLTINAKTGEKKILSASRKGNLKRILSFPKLMGSNAETREVALTVPKGKSVDLVLINVDTGHRRTLDSASEDTLTWLLDDSMRPVMRIDETKSGALQKYFASDDGGRTWNLRFQHDVLNEGFAPISYLEQQEKLAVIARPPGEERKSLFQFSLKQGQFGEKIFGHDTYDLNFAKRKRGSGNILYADYWNDKLERHWFSEVDAKMGHAIDKALPENANWTIYDMSANGEDWIIYVSSPTNPGSYYVLLRDLKILRKISDARPGVDLKSTSPTHRFDYEAADGIQLRGYFTPSIVASNTAPLIVMPHGGPVSRDHMDWEGWAQYFAFRGYSVFQPQFRGSGGFGSTFEQMGHGEWGRAMQQDIADGVRALEQAGLVEPTQPRSIVGASYGGYAALAAATMTPDAYQCVISYAGVSDLPRMIRQYDTRDPVESFLRTLWLRRMNNGSDDESELWQRSPIAYIDKLKAQVFVIHGNDDEIVRVEQSTAFYDAAIKAGKYARIRLLENTGHRIYRDETNTDLLVAMNDFLVRCMPPPSIRQISPKSP